MILFNHKPHFSQTHYHAFPLPLHLTPNSVQRLSIAVTSIPTFRSSLVPSLHFSHLSSLEAGGRTAHLLAVINLHGKNKSKVRVQSTMSEKAWLQKQPQLQAKELRVTDHPVATASHTQGTDQC